MRVWRLSVAYIGPKSRTERPRKAKIGTEVGHITCDSDTTFNVKRSKVNLQEAGAYCGGLPNSLYYIATPQYHFWSILMAVLFAECYITTLIWINDIAIIVNKC